MMEFRGTDWQKEIYLKGFAGTKSSVPVNFSQLEKKAKMVLSKEAFAYIAGGAGRGDTMKANRRAFKKFRIVPRMLRDVSERDTSVTLFGHTLPSPIILSPIGVLEMVHEQSDLEVARVSAELGLPFVLSNQASRPMEEVSSAMGKSPRWFQLYWSKSNDLVASFVQRAETCGCSAIVVTLDATMLGWRTRDLDIPYLPFLYGKGIAQYTSDPVFQKLMDDETDSVEIRQKITRSSVYGLLQLVKRYPGNGFLSKVRSGRPVKAVRKFVSLYSNPAVTWDDLNFLRTQTQLPILLKGILHPDDARQAIDYGMDGIIVSNHGGRQVDGAIGTCEALPGIVDAVKGRVPVLIDGGIRGGADIFKSLALGATAVCIGRPYVYGLAISGSRGVYEVLRNLMADFDLTMGLAGCKNISEINAGQLVRP